MEPATTSSVICPHCQADATASPDVAGMRRCPQCQAWFAHTPSKVRIPLPPGDNPTPAQFIRTVRGRSCYRAFRAVADVSAAVFHGIAYVVLGVATYAAFGEFGWAAIAIGLAIMIGCGVFIEAARQGALVVVDIADMLARLTQIADSSTKLETL